MRRYQIIAAAALLGLLGAAAPIAAALYVSWTFAVKTEQARLSSFAVRTITRANKSLDEIRSALSTIAQSQAEPCSPEHILQMRALTFKAPSIEEVGYFDHGVLLCTSWGKTEKRIEYHHGDYTTADGIEVTIRMRPLMTADNTMMAFQYKAYNALVDPLRFVDVIVDPNIQLAIVGQTGAIIGTLNEPNPYLLQSIISHPTNGMGKKDLFAVAQANGWMAVAIEPRAGMLPNLRRERLVLLPIGALLAASVVVVVIVLSRRRFSPLGELAIAIRNHEFVVHYQPIIELKTGRCIGGEALVRWRHPNGSLVRPDLFVPIAEDSGLIGAITNQVIETVISDLKKHLLVDRTLHIAINLSAFDVKSDRILSVINNALENTGIQARQIWLEITERGFIDVDSVRSTITTARQTGHLVAIDDFGTGYSSLQYLQGFPLDVLKIDKSFVATIGTDSAKSSVIPHIIGMAKALKLKIIAEGVDSDLQVKYLNSRQVEFAQGWLFSQPLPAEEFIAFCRSTRRSFASSGDVASENVS